jgi:pyruvate/2-oxoglutarate dehydrogenase complex dihydrolipoamide acyltransferase (E2) component
VYAVEFCGTAALVATGAHDGAVHLFDARCGRRLAELQVCGGGSGGFVSCLAHDAAGGRLYAGDGSGCVHELALAAAERTMPLAAPAATPPAATASSTPPPPPATTQQQPPSPPPPQQQQQLRPLRTCAEMLGRPLLQLLLHPSGRQLIALAGGGEGGGGSGGGEVVALDLRRLQLVRRYAPAVRCARLPLLKAAVSPGQSERAVCGATDLF